LTAHIDVNTRARDKGATLHDVPSMLDAALRLALAAAIAIGIEVAVHAAC
jgi:hypothetical protein